MTLDYDPATDSLYVKLRPGEAVGNRVLSDDVVIDLGADDAPVGYDIQHASQNADAIAEALDYSRRRFAGEAHRQSGPVAGSRKRIDPSTLREMTDQMPMQRESAGDFIRRMRDEDRY
jgi:uncharacterized protein YuzE